MGPFASVFSGSLFVPTYPLVFIDVSLFLCCLKCATMFPYLQFQLGKLLTMGGWMDECMDGWVGGWVDGWMGGWMDGWMD